MTHAGPARALAAGIAVTALLTTAACSGSSSGGKKSTPSATPTVPSSAASTPAAPAKPAAVNWLRGGKYSANGVVAVKIDDTANGRPQRNIDSADVVYVEEVEGGLTRLLAIFHTNLPTVEAVRSTRAADPEIVSQYGPVAYAASGGAPNPLYILDHSYLKTTINDRGGPGFQRDGSRNAPYNLTADLATIAKVLKAPKARYVGFRWSYSLAQLAGAPAAPRISTVVGGTAVGFQYDAKAKRYDRIIDGSPTHQADGKVVSTPNVIVQFCQVEPYLKDRDVLGNPNAYTHTVGSGRIALFRDGRRVDGTWKRTSKYGPTTYLDAKGRPIILQPGGVWVVLVHRTAPLSS